MAKDDEVEKSLFAALRRLTGQVAGGTLELARGTATLTAMFGESWLRAALLNPMEPARQEAMREAGGFLRDARETAGLSIRELSERLGLADRRVLEDIERGRTIMPLELMLRCASLVARHDPIPFLIKFLRTYNPALEKALENWGVLALSRQFERERRFINLYRQHDVLRELSEDEFERYTEYMLSTTNLVIDMMRREREAHNLTEAGAAASPPMASPPPEKPVAAKPTAALIDPTTRGPARQRTPARRTASRPKRPKRPAASTRNNA